MCRRAWRHECRHVGRLACRHMSSYVCRHVRRHSTSLSHVDMRTACRRDSRRLHRPLASRARVRSQSQCRCFRRSPVQVDHDRYTFGSPMQVHRDVQRCSISVACTRAVLPRMSTSGLISSALVRLPYPLRREVHAMSVELRKRLARAREEMSRWTKQWTELSIRRLTRTHFDRPATTQRRQRKKKWTGDEQTEPCCQFPVHRPRKMLCHAVLSTKRS